MESKGSVTSFTVLLFFFATVLVGAVGAGPFVDAAVAGAVDGPGNKTAWMIKPRSLEPFPAAAAAGREVRRRILQSRPELDPRAVHNPNRQGCIGPCPAPGYGYTGEPEPLPAELDQVRSLLLSVPTNRVLDKDHGVCIRGCAARSPGDSYTRPCEKSHYCPP